MSSPRREWWSFLWERRCSVSSLMRSVSSATCTRVLPVSCAFAPNCATISDLRSWVRAMRRGSLAAVEVPADVVDVAVHLRDEGLDRGEAPFPAQALAELDAQRAVVEVAVEVEQVGLDELVAPGLELGAHADVDRGRAFVGEARVDAVARGDVAGRGDDVRGREAELAPAGVAVDDRAAHRERRAEQPPGVLDRAAEDEPADVAGGHD